MVVEEWLRDVLQRKELTRIDRLVLCLAVGGGSPKSVAELRSIATRNGLRAIAKWNVSALLGGSKGKAVRTDKGWELTSAGRRSVAFLKNLLGGTEVVQPGHELRRELAKIRNSDTKGFVAEAVGCYEGGHYRAAAVLSWVGAVAVLYDLVVLKHLAAFNSEARRRDTKWKDARTPDGLGRMKESDFLQVLEDIGVIGKSTKKELGQALDLRNACGHPSTLKLGGARVAGHVESLILNVFVPFA